MIAAPPLSERSATELDLVADFLFEAPDRLASTERARSRGPDGTVSLELYAGADEELEATARWVAEEVFERGTPLHEIAVLVPTADPLASIVADRIGELEWPADIEPVYVAGGRPAVSGASGARLLAVVRALQGYLPAEAMLALIPRLRLSGSDAHVTPGRARAVVSALGTLGGSAARPSDALCWSERLHRADLDDVVRALAPSIEALVAIAAEVLSGAPLTSLWRALRELVMTHVIGSAEMVGLVEQLGDAISEIAADPVAMDVVGVDAIDLVASTLCSLRLQEGRYGGPSIYVGTISGAAGLRFSAIRIIGLTEGAFPGTLREDAVLPSELRQRLPRYAMPTDDDYATGRLHAFARVVRGATRRLVLSAPRTAVDGSEREPAAVFIEVAAALGRPNATTGAPASVVPTRLELERDAFQVARADATARMLASPLSASCWLRSVAFVGEGSASREIPSAWVRTIVTDPVEILARSSNMDGVLGPAPLSVRPHGVSAERPVSASTLRMLLTCPQRFLLERMLGFRPRSQPPGAGRVDRLDPAFYGTLVHAVAEAFSREHGREFGARERDLSHWIELADAVACATFDAFIEPYPLFGRGAVEHERRRLRRDVRTFIEEDWDHGRPRAFVAVEQRFGEAHPVSIPTAAGPLFVSGCIDRIDLENGLTLVRDLKTGRARPRERDHSDPEIELDLQLAVYVAVVRGLAAEWSIPGDVAAAYLYVDPLAVVRERAFREDRVMLRTVSQRWFDVATSLIREQAYVQTPDREDCGRCPFEAVCGDGVEATSRRLAGALGTLGAFRDLKS
ncbi:MAG: PD-(D/E)XK nuclease family protein [Kofleriaceae bacterium]